MNICETLNSFCDYIISDEIVRWDFEDQYYVTKDRFDEKTALFIADILRAAFAVPDAIIGVSSDRRYGSYKMATNTRIIIKSIDPCLRKIEKAYATFKETTNSRQVESILESVAKAPFQIRVKMYERFPWLQNNQISAHSLLKEGHFMLCMDDLRDGSPSVFHITPDDVQFIRASLQ